MNNQVKVKMAKVYKIKINTKNYVKIKMRMSLNKKLMNNKSKIKANTFDLLLNI